MHTPSFCLYAILFLCVHICQSAYMSYFCLPSLRRSRQCLINYELVSGEWVPTVCLSSLLNHFVNGAEVSRMVASFSIFSGHTLIFPFSHFLFPFYFICPSVSQHRWGRNVSHCLSDLCQSCGRNSPLIARIITRWLPPRSVLFCSLPQAGRSGRVTLISGLLAERRTRSLNRQSVCLTCFHPKSKLVSFINAQLFWRKRIQDQYIYMSVFGSCDCVRPVCTVYETCLFCVRFSKPVFSCHRVVFLEQEKLWNASNQCTSTNRESVVFWNSSWRKTMRYIYIPISASSS